MPTARRGAARSAPPARSAPRAAEPKLTAVEIGELEFNVRRGKTVVGRITGYEAQTADGQVATNYAGRWLDERHPALKGKRYGGSTSTEALAAMAGDVAALEALS